jgi:cysteine desulfurase
LASPRAYLDHNATTPLRPAAREAVYSALDLAGNASSIHAEGRMARALIETARAEIAGFVGAKAKNVFFTSGGTEALNLVLTPHVQITGDSTAIFDLLLIGAGEHACVISGHRFSADAVELVSLDSNGRLDLDALDDALNRNKERRIMLSLQAANNETGVLQPVAAAAERLHAQGGFLVCDAIQTAGRIDCNIAALGADALVLSAHKFGGPKGVGALCFASDTSHITNTMVRGGGQERGLRSGTENIAAIAGFAAGAKAANLRRSEEMQRLSCWRDELEAEISRIAPDASFFGAGAGRLPNTSCFAVPGIEAQVLLIVLDVEGVAVSSGSACSSGKVKRSHVLQAMGVEPALAEGAIRVSFGWSSRSEELVLFVRSFEKAVRTIRTRQVKTAA